MRNPPRIPDGYINLYAVIDDDGELRTYATQAMHVTRKTADKIAGLTSFHRVAVIRVYLKIAR